jgi:hypothetical protein
LRNGGIQRSFETERFKRKETDGKGKAKRMMNRRPAEDCPKKRPALHFCLEFEEETVIAVIATFQFSDH